uniref:Uncharacterized protein n=1 Tax=Anopheles culicifacies TaxID=139723 RepID=A0A182M3D3_9DIPT
MSTGVVSLAVVAIAVHVLLLTSAFVDPADGAVRGADRRSYTSAMKSTIDRQGLAVVPAYTATIGHRRGAKNYACLQDLTQALVPPGPELGSVRSAEETEVLMEDRTVVLGEDEADADIDDDIDTGSGTNVSTVGSGLSVRRMRGLIYLFRGATTCVRLAFWFPSTVHASHKGDARSGPVRDPALGATVINDRKISYIGDERMPFAS